MATQPQVSHQSTAEATSFLTDSAPVTDEMIQDFVRATGDNNPIHTSDLAAQAVRLPRRVAHGKLVQSVAVNLIRVKEEGEGYLPILLGDTWMMNTAVYPGDRIYARYRKSSPTRKCVIDVTVIAVRPDGVESIACTGEITALIRQQR